MIWIEGSFGVLLSMVCSDGLGEHRIRRRPRRRLVGNTAAVFRRLPRPLLRLPDPPDPAGCRRTFDLLAGSLGPLRSKWHIPLAHIRRNWSEFGETALWFAERRRHRHGRGSVLQQVQKFHPKAALEHGLAGRNYFTLPDYRYRSCDCLRLIDSRSGATQCAACLRPSEPPLSPLLNGIHISFPLRRPHQENNLHQQQEEEQQNQHQQHVMQYSFLLSEPLNLSLHHSMTNSLARPSPQPNKQPSSFLPVTSAYTSTTNYTGDQRLLQLDPCSSSLHRH